MALQGAVLEHVEALRRALRELRLEGEILTVKKSAEVDLINGIVIPGGESTVIGRLAKRFGLLNKLRESIEAGLAVMGTCAGMVLLAKEVVDAKLGPVDQPILRMMDARVVRNAFGRQRESFEVDLSIPALGREPFRAVFIRAPIIEKALSNRVEILARFEDKIVAARQDNMLASSFHPELTNDPRLHQYFLRLILGEA